MIAHSNPLGRVSTTHLDDAESQDLLDRALLKATTGGKIVLLGLEPHRKRKYARGYYSRQPKSYGIDLS